MNNYSTAVQLAWQISCYEAANKKLPFIEVDHIMLGILSLDKVNLAKMNLSEQQQRNFVEEKDDFYNRLNTFGINIVKFRRALRDLLPMGNGIPEDKVIHRSAECKSIFENAAIYANQELKIRHLFYSMIGWNSSCSKKLFSAFNIDMNQFKSDILFSRYRIN